MTTVVLIDDDPMITDPVRRALEAQRFDVQVAHTGTDGVALVQSTDPDVVVLDIMLPEMSGWDVCRELRQTSIVPILMLTALDEEVDRILGLELGADDYLTKPFSIRELVARIRALLRRVQFEQRGENQNNKQPITIGNLQLDHDRREVKKDGSFLHLRYKEFELLAFLMHAAGKVVTRETLFNELWGSDWYGDTRTLDVHIRWLREKIEDDPGQPRYIQTVRGVGYRFLGKDAS